MAESSWIDKYVEKDVEDYIKSLHSLDIEFESKKISLLESLKKDLLSKWISFTRRDKDCDITTIGKVSNAIVYYHNLTLSVNLINIILKYSTGDIVIKYKTEECNFNLDYSEINIITEDKIRNLLLNAL